MSESKHRVLFYRRLLHANAGSNGGNLKLRDCFDHILFSQQYKPEIYFSEDTCWFDQVNHHWSSLKEQALKKWEILPGDILFFSGADWQALPEDLRRQPPVPVINIVQPRHTRSTDKRQAYLKYPAIRIAKSDTGAKILKTHGLNGPLYTIPDAIDLSLLPKVPQQKDIDVLILGLKQPEFAKAVHSLILDWAKVHCPDLKLHVQLPPKLPTRQAFLSLLSQAKIVACIPLDVERGAEGFYLPALEAMALECLVVCPHAIGNVDHCLDGINCIVPGFTPESVFQGVIKALALNQTQLSALLKNGLETANRHSIEQERQAILDLVHRAYDIWEQPLLFTPVDDQQNTFSIKKQFKKVWGKIRGKKSK